MEGSDGYRNRSTNQTRNIQDGGSTSRLKGNRKQMGFSHQTRSQWENCETQGKARCKRIFSNSRNRFCGDFCTSNEVGNLQATHGTRNKTWFNNSCGRRCGSLSQLGIGTGNPGVFQGYPYPYPGKPVPVFQGTGFEGYGYGWGGRCLVVIRIK